MEKCGHMRTGRGRGSKIGKIFGSSFMDGLLCFLKVYLGCLFCLVLLRYILEKGPYYPVLFEVYFEIPFYPVLSKVYFGSQFYPVLFKVYFEVHFIRCF